LAFILSKNKPVKLAINASVCPHPTVNAVAIQGTIAHTSAEDVAVPASFLYFILTLGIFATEHLKRELVNKLVNFENKKIMLIIITQRAQHCFIGSL